MVFGKFQMGLEYLFVTGFHGSRLIYTPSEKNLYAFKDKRGNGESFICYQYILNKQKNGEEEHSKCSARVVLDKDKNVTRNHIEHSHHKNHEQIYADMISASTMKNKVRELRDEFPEMLDKISVDNIFLKEQAK